MILTKKIFFVNLFLRALLLVDTSKASGSDALLFFITEIR